MVGGISARGETLSLIRTSVFPARAFEAEPSGLLKEDLSLREPTHSTHVEMSSSASSATRHPSSTAEPMFINEQPTAMVEAPRRAKVRIISLSLD